MKKIVRVAHVAGDWILCCDRRSCGGQLGSAFSLCHAHHSVTCRVEDAGHGDIFYGNLVGNNNR